MLFCARGATSDPLKGFDALSKALNKFKDTNIEFVMFGSGKPKESQKIWFKTHYLGAFSDDI